LTQFLDKIFALKKKEVEEKRKRLPFFELFRCVKDLPSSRSFSQALYRRGSIIAEIKKASPSRGPLSPSVSVAEMGRIYQQNGASAVSVVTDAKYFSGRLQDIGTLRRHLEVPILRKDFIIDEYQILESKQSGADAVLLIASLLSTRQIRQFLKLTRYLGMEALVEIHSENELHKALETEAESIGVNNRNLRSLEVDMKTSMELLPKIPNSKIKVVESGIRLEKDLISYMRFNVNAFLVGEALMTAAQPSEKLRRYCSLLGNDDEN